MPSYLLLNKPFQVLCQFTDTENRQTLADYIDVPNVYSAGRLDYDSEGLLLLTDDGGLIHNMMNPKFKVPKTYLAQVEGQPSQSELHTLENGVTLKDGLTAPCKIELIDEPDWLWPRTPPIRERKNSPTQWIKITITEGRNRQVRRMTSHIGYPTLRLIRSHVGELFIGDLELGQYRVLNDQELKDNGINLEHKKGSSKAAQNRNRPNAKRWGQHPLRNQHRQNRNRKA